MVASKKADTRYSEVRKANEYVDGVVCAMFSMLRNINATEAAAKTYTTVPASCGCFVIDAR